MIRVNKDYVLKKTIFGRRYLSNAITGDMIDINEVTEDIFNKITENDMNFEQLIDWLCEEYNAPRTEIEEGTREVLELLEEYNVII